MDEATLEVMAEMHGEDLDDIIASKTSYTVQELNEKLDKHLKETTEPKRDRIAVESFIEWFDENDRTNFDEDTIRDHFQYLVEDGYAVNTITSGRYYGLVKFADMQLSAVAEAQIRDMSQSEVVKAAFENSDREENGRMGAGARPITEEEKDKMVRTAPTLRTELMTEILWQCGLRAEELAKSEVERIELDEKQLTVDTVKREGHTRTIPFDLELKFKIQKYLDTQRRKYGRESDYLFVSQSSAHPQAHNLSRTIRDLADDAGIQSYTTHQNGAKRGEITPHSFRKAFGIRMDEQGKSIKEIAETLGHSNTQSVSTYLDIQ